jgi:hypothetical protein
MINVMRQMRGTLNLNDLLLIVSLALFLPLRLAFPLATQIMSMRISIRLTGCVQEPENSGTRPIPIPS